MRAHIRTLAAILALARAARADCPMHTQTFVVPVWATDPNEGNTYGVMPIFIHVCTKDRHTQWILAPSATWNSVIHLTGTVRWYGYPDDDTTLVVIASASTRLNRRVIAAWQHQPIEPYAWTYELSGGLVRDGFARFWGLGPDTSSDAETSYTATRAYIGARGGIALADHLNFGVTLGAEHDGVEDEGVKDLPLSPDVFPDAPGMHGASLLTQGIDLRYDDRGTGGDFAAEGVRVDLWAAYVEGLSRSPNFLRTGLQANGIWPELDWLSGAARFYWNRVGSAEAPFYQQSSLGGAFLLRGFSQGRFVDRQAWTAEIEQRILLMQTHFFGVITDWRVDPFVTTGQVFGALSSVLSNPQVAVGVGLRAFVRPKVVGRLDVAYGGEGVKLYVEIGYPY